MNAISEEDELLPEYEFTDEQLRSAERGKYAGRFTRLSIVRPDPDVAELFPTSDAVNTALRALGTIIRAREEEKAA